MATSRKTTSKAKGRAPARGTGKGAKPPAPGRRATAMKAPQRAKAAQPRATAARTDRQWTEKQQAAIRASAPAKPAQLNRIVGKPEQPAGTNKGGRPPIHTPELAALFCEHLMEGCTLREACAKDGMPNVKTILRWLHDDTGGFRSQYARAREVQAELDADDVVRLADQVLHAVKRTVKGKGKTRQVEEVFGDAVERSRLMVDGRKWRAAKMAPKKYGSLLDAGGEGLALVLVNDMTGRKPQQPDPGEAQGGASA